jgi:hypothetical protein
MTSCQHKNVSVYSNVMKNQNSAITKILANVSLGYERKINIGLTMLVV